MQLTAERPQVCKEAKPASARRLTRIEKAPIDEERRFLIEELFFSTTDFNGVIRYGNEVFSRVAGIELEQLQGTPHSIIRHPDMPRVVFKLLWDTIQAGKTIAAYVKNLAADGRYYWVLAIVMPTSDGYLSVRLKPSSTIFPKVVQLYKRLLQIEQAIEVQPKQREAAMQASGKELLDQLSELGFDNYESFMLEALSAELCSRQQIIRGEPNTIARSMTSSQWMASKYDAAHANCREIDRQLQDIFDQLDQFKAVGLSLGEKNASILSSADTIRMLAMNAAISAHKLGPRAATLQVVSESLGSVSKESAVVIKELAEQLQTVVASLKQLIFDVSATKLQCEISLTFLAEILSGSESEPNHHVQSSLRTLFEQMSARVEQLFDHLSQMQQQMNVLQKPLQKLDRNNRTLRFVQFSGKKESSGWAEASEFAVVIAEVPAQTAKTKEECDSLTQSLERLLRHLTTLSEGREAFSERLALLLQSTN